MNKITTFNLSNKGIMMSDSSSHNLELIRPDLYTNRYRSYKVFINNRKTNNIKNGETLKLNLSPGIYTIYFKIDWVKSKKFQFEILDNKNVQLLIEANKMTLPKAILLFGISALFAGLGVFLAGYLGAGIGGAIGGGIYSSIACKPYIKKV